ncbi:uncharacterized protein METZ01_LOCUS83556 [marine metagenome]|uniref:Uncharacterized protein n=1 Tax=marine metagenome TaxID=408172 RepID=A0A381UR96_9ZZZZ
MVGEHSKHELFIPYALKCVKLDYRIGET